MRFVKYSNLGLAVLILLMPFNIAKADMSGACSSHGGIDISIGADSDGSVICNDGWLNSSVLYVPQPPLRPPTCWDQSQVAALISQNISNGTSRYSPLSASGAEQACQNSVTAYQTDLLSYQTKLVTYNQQLQHQKLWGIQVRKQQSDNSERENKQRAANDAKTYCELHNGNFLIVDNSCNCKIGYEPNSDQTNCVLLPKQEVISPVTPNSDSKLPIKISEMQPEKSKIYQTNTQTQVTSSQSKTEEVQQIASPESQGESPKLNIVHRVFNSIVNFFKELFK